MAGRLAADGVAASYLPFGVDADALRPTSPGICTECTEPHGVVFIGQHSDKREKHLAAVLGHSVALWGSRWNRAMGSFDGRHRIHRAPAFGAACAKLYASAGVSLNIVDDLNMPGHNMRTFEVPGAGGVMLSTYTAEQAEFFPENEAALYYREPGEIDDKIEHILTDREWAQTLRQRAFAIAGKHHYTERAKVIAVDLAL
jgi:spore maturation protein CgeB